LPKQKYTIIVDILEKFTLTKRESDER